MNEVIVAILFLLTLIVSYTVPYLVVLKEFLPAAKVAQAKAAQAGADQPKDGQAKSKDGHAKQELLYSRTLDWKLIPPFLKFRFPLLNPQLANDQTPINVKFAFLLRSVLVALSMSALLDFLRTYALWTTSPYWLTVPVLFVIFLNVGNAVVGMFNLAYDVRNHEHLEKREDSLLDQRFLKATQRRDKLVEAHKKTFKIDKYIAKLEGIRADEGKKYDGFILWVRRYILATSIVGFIAVAVVGIWGLLKADMGIIHEFWFVALTTALMLNALRAIFSFCQFEVIKTVQRLTKGNNTELVDVDGHVVPPMDVATSKEITHKLHSTLQSLPAYIFLLISVGVIWVVEKINIFKYGNTAYFIFLGLIVVPLFSEVVFSYRINRFVIPASNIHRSARAELPLKDVYRQVLTFMIFFAVVGLFFNLILDVGPDVLTHYIPSTDLQKIKVSTEIQTTFLPLPTQVQGLVPHREFLGVLSIVAMLLAVLFAFSHFNYLFPTLWRQRVLFKESFFEKKSRESGLSRSDRLDEWMKEMFKEAPKELREWTFRLLEIASAVAFTIGLINFGPGAAVSCGFADTTMYYGQPVSDVSTHLSQSVGFDNLLTFADSKLENLTHRRYLPETKALLIADGQVQLYDQGTIPFSAQYVITPSDAPILTNSDQSEESAALPSVTTVKLRPLSLLEPGDHTISAAYQSTAHGNGHAVCGHVTVVKDQTSMAIQGLLVEPPSSLVSGDTSDLSVALTSVNGPKDLTFTGNITFTDVDPTGKVLKTDTVAVSGAPGTTYTDSFVAPMTLGEQTVTIRYSGDQHYASSTQSFQIDVLPSPPPGCSAKCN